MDINVYDLDKAVFLKLEVYQGWRAASFSSRLSFPNEIALRLSYYFDCHLNPLLFLSINFNYSIKHKKWSLSE